MPKVSTLLPHRFRTIWISDVHLGFKGCQADFLLEFLHSTQCDHLYLVGDIIDVWTMKRGLYWPQEHNNVVRSLLGKAKHNTQVIYVPGNHDEVFRDHAGMIFGNVSIQITATHTTADGQKLLMLHGDEFDNVVKCSPWLAHLGSYAYDLLLATNGLVNRTRRLLGLPYWSLAAFLKKKVKNAVNYISNFELAVVKEADEHDVQGLVCGHIHHAAIQSFDGIHYYNCGDWVESCTALVEDFNGKISLVRWTEQGLETLVPAGETSAGQAPPPLAKPAYAAASPTDNDSYSDNIRSAKAGADQPSA
jgi:UDP-2,3-diacylglucosamine pyrophosphatase LpxH